jgi:hypothetical protein
VEFGQIKLGWKMLGKMNVDHIRLGCQKMKSRACYRVLKWQCLWEIEIMAVWVNRLQFNET